MRALVKTEKGRGNLELREVPCPQTEAGEVLVRVRACGVCGSDLKIQDDAHPYLPPVVIGHEFAGEIVESGASVSAWKPGDRIVSEQHFKACGHCRACLSGNAFACSSKRAPGYFSDGAFAEFIKVPAWLLHRIPERLSFVEAALTEPSAVAAHGMLERTGIEPEDVVLILGCGPIGLAAAKMAQAAGASRVIITGVDRDETRRLPKARELGIDHVVAADELPRLGVERDLPRAEQESSRDHSLGVGADRRGRLRGRDVRSRSRRFRCSSQRLVAQMRVPLRHLRALLRQ